jgi:hypothetical protein
MPEQNIKIINTLYAEVTSSLFNSAKPDRYGLWEHNHTIIGTTTSFNLIMWYSIRDSHFQLGFGRQIFCWKFKEQLRSWAKFHH